MGNVLKAGMNFIGGDYVGGAAEAAQIVQHEIQMQKARDFFNNTEVVVGITSETNVEREDGDTNASVLYKNEKGTPSQNIPPRPVLRPAITQGDIKERIQQMMKMAMDEAFKNGNIEKASQFMEKAGMVGRDACKKYIKDGTHLAPNAKITILRKGSSTPLVDTGSLVNSITYAVRKKGTNNVVEA